MNSIHASCVDLHGFGVLLIGPSGCGKSGLCLALMEHGARLVADDRVMLDVTDGMLFASPHPELSGLLEVRGIGITRWQHQPTVSVRLIVEHAETAERLPEPTFLDWSGCQVPSIKLPLHHGHAPTLVRLALAVFLGEHAVSPAAGLVGKVA